MANNMSFYSWAERHMVIDMDNETVICHVPDQCGAWFRVSVNESGLVPVPTGCTCGRQLCNHRDVVTAFYQRIYKSNVAKQAAKTEASATPAEVEVATPAPVKKPAILNQSVNLTGATELYDGSRPLTTKEWKEIHKRDKERQAREKKADWDKILEARAQSKRGYKSSALAS